MEKQCFKCGATKPLSEFYKHAQMGDGHLNKCKDCTKSDVMRHREANLLRIRAYDRERPNKAERYKANRAWTKTPSGRAAVSAAKNAYRQKFYERARAREMLKNAIRDGKVTKLPCLVCGATPTEGHHASYSLPLDVVWLCRTHHAQTHREHREYQREEAGHVA